MSSPVPHRGDAQHPAEWNRSPEHVSHVLHPVQFRNLTMRMSSGKIQAGSHASYQANKAAHDFIAAASY